MTKLWFLGLLGGFFAAMVAIVDNSYSATILTIGLLLASIEVAVLSRIAGGFTPVVIPVLTVNSILLASLLFWDQVHEEAEFGFKLQVTEDYLIHGVVIGIVFSVAYTVGALLAGPRNMHISVQRIANSVRDIGVGLRIPNGILVAVGYAGLALTIYAYQGAILRSVYQQSNGPHWAVVLSYSFSYVAMLALCIAAAKPGPWRVAAIVGIGIWALILFGRGTRNIAVLPALIVLGRASVSGWKLQKRYLAIVAVVTVMLIQVAIYTRSNPAGVGILPVTQLMAQPDLFLSASSVKGTIGNALASGPLTAVVADRPIAPGALWTSLNPMPGGVAGWTEIQESLRLNEYTPYNTLGELGAHGWVALVAVAGVVGFVLSVLTRVASNLRGAYAITASIFVLAVVALYSVMILQYNLRSTTRLVWYAIFGIAVIWFVHAAKQETRGRRAAPAGSPGIDRIGHGRLGQFRGDRTQSHSIW